MSSSTVRTTLKNFITSNSAESVIDLTGEFENINKLLQDEGIGHNDDWVGIQFIGNDERPIGLAADNASGCYRETGSFFFHVVAKSKTSSKTRDNILPRIEALRNLLRGQNISGIIIEGVTPPNFESGATLQFEGGYQSATFTAIYQNDINL